MSLSVTFASLMTSLQPSFSWLLSPFLVSFLFLRTFGQLSWSKLAFLFWTESNKSWGIIHELYPDVVFAENKGQVLHPCRKLLRDFPEKISCSIVPYLCVVALHSKHPSPLHVLSVNFSWVFLWPVLVFELSLSSREWVGTTQLSFTLTTQSAPSSCLSRDLHHSFT